LVRLSKRINRQQLLAQKPKYEDRKIKRAQPTSRLKVYQKLIDVDGRTGMMGFNVSTKKTNLRPPQPVMLLLLQQGRDLAQSPRFWEPFQQPVFSSMSPERIW